LSLEPGSTVMTDFFALLDLPRRPWLDPDSLKQKFLRLSAEVHPDRVHNAGGPEKLAAQDRYTGLNTAYNCLREPKERLLHLLELERGTKPKDVQNIPPDLMNVFLEVSQLCREIDEFLPEKVAVTSPLLKVPMFERSQAWADKLMALQKRINSWREELIAELKAIDERWNPDENAAQLNRAATLQRLEELYRLFSYLARWSNQMQERLVQLSF